MTRKFNSENQFFDASENHLEMDELMEHEKMPRDKYIQMYESVGAAMEVYNILHRGMEEAIYQEALEMELTYRNIPFVPQQTLYTWYKGKRLKKEYVADIVTYSDVVLELKSVSKIITDHRAQLFNYLRLTHKPIGLLINFGQPSLQGERYAYDEETNECILLDKNMQPVYE